MKIDHWHNVFIWIKYLSNKGILASLFSYILKNNYIGLPELINVAHWSFPPVKFHGGLFLPASETSMSLTKAAAFSDFVSSGVAQIPNVCDANQHMWTRVSALSVPSWMFPQLTGFCVNRYYVYPILLLFLLFILDPLHLLQWQQNKVLALNGFLTLFSVFCFHHFQLFPNIFPVTTRKGKMPRRTRNNSSDVLTDFPGNSFAEKCVK